MNKSEFKAAFALANSQVDLSEADIDVFDGFGLPDFRTAYVTIRQVARLILWQAQYMGGGWDSDALREIAELGRQRFMVIDSAAAAA